MVWPEQSHHIGPAPGALEGDDYPLEYYEDGYPKLPACLDRRNNQRGSGLRAEPPSLTPIANRNAFLFGEKLTRYLAVASIVFLTAL